MEAIKQRDSTVVQSTQVAGSARSKPNPSEGVAARKNARAKKKGNGVAYRIALGGVVVALLIQSGSHTYSNMQLLESLEARKLLQARQIAEIEASRGQLEGIAGKLALLAESGNTNAMKIIERFKNSGVRISAPQ